MSTNAIRSLFLNGPVGRLEAVLNEGASDAKYAALVCHPHPVYGGTLHNKVVFHTMKALNHFGFPVLRFNFRGAGLSQGTHDHGQGELDDVRTALEWLDQEFHLPMFFAGFSFGSVVGMQVACPDARVKKLIALGLPVSPIDDRRYNFQFLHHCSKPKFFISGAQDQYAPRQELERVIDALPQPRELKIIENADHFFEGKLPEMRSSLEHWIKKQLEG
ncbi:MAG TPA: alpha/beta fold hydrolase [Terriglobales bacterium]|nr:alpha/beta fold hydrolase [Terriglobales bacterium]